MKFRYKYSTNIEKSALKNRKKCEQTALSCNRLRRTVLQHSSSSKNEAGGETMRGREDHTFPVINRVGAWGLVPHASSHTTVRAVRHTAVPLSIIPSCPIEVHIIFRKRGIARLLETFVRHRLMHHRV